MKKSVIVGIKKYVEEHLAKLGFEPGKTFHVRSIQDNFRGLVGLNIASYRTDGLIGVAPTILVEYLPISAIVNSLTGRKLSTHHPSVSSQLGYLMPEKRFLEWLFDPSKDLHQRDEIDHMCKAIEVYGESFMHRKASIDEIVYSLELRDNFSFKETARYHLPIVYRLIGLIEKADEFVRNRLVEIEYQNDIASVEYRRFADRFLATSNVQAINRKMLLDD